VGLARLGGASPSLEGKLTILENTLTIKPHLFGGFWTGGAMLHFMFDGDQLPRIRFPAPAAH
jgi:hypothetical protein